LTTNNRQKITVFLTLSSFLAAHLCFWLLPDVFEIWNAQAVDQLFVFRSSSRQLRPPYDHTLAHVDLNNTTIRRLSNQYLDRSHFAQVVGNLASMNVSAQVYDFIFAARLDKEADQSLIDATAEAGSVYFGMAFELRREGRPHQRQPRDPDEMRYLDQSKWQVVVEGDPGGFYRGTNSLLTFPELTAASRGLGSLSVKFDRDGVLRRVPLLVRYEEAFYPLLPFRVICDYLGVPPEKILIKPGRHIILKDAQKPGEDAHDIVIPIDKCGNMVVNFIGPWGRMDHYNFADILLASEDRDELEMWGEELGGKIVVVSDVSTGSTDIGPVPTDDTFPLSGVHANIMHSILTESFLRELSSREMLIVEFVLLTVVLILSLGFSSLYFSLGALLVVASYICLVSVGFLYGNFIFHLVRPLLMVGLAVTSTVVYRYINEEREKMEGLRQRDFIRATFGRYLSSEVVEELLGSPEGLKMSGEIREVTFLVSDLRGFTSLSSRLSPHDVIQTMNRYFERMVETIARYRGTVDEFQGDGILVFFGAPLAERDDPERAVACAIEMQRRMPEINEVQRQCNLPELAMGIGINTGEVIVGNIGSEKRSKYGALGTAINTAYRIESYTTGGQILISPSTYEKVRSLVSIRQTTEVQFKGIDHLVTLYDVIGMGGKFELSLPQEATKEFTDLEPPLDITCFPLKGKTVSDTAMPGHIRRLGESAAEVSLQGQLAVHSNLKILLAPEGAPGSSQAYAKVISIHKPESGSPHTRALLEFTWLSKDAQTLLKERTPQSCRGREAATKKPLQAKSLTPGKPTSK